MTAYTSSTAGNWGTGTNWTPNGVPGDGDTATIASGSNITVAANAIIGTSPAAGNIVLTVNSGATLTINDNISFTLRGDALCKGTGKILAGAGIIFEFDSSLASSPTSQKYQVAVGDTHNSTPSFNITGTAGNRSIVRSNAGGANGRITDGSGPWLQSGLMTCVYTDFQSIGDSSNAAIMPSPSGSSVVFSLIDCTFDTACGRIEGTYNVGANVTFKLQRVNHAGNVGSDNLVYRGSAGIGTGVRLIDACFFNKNVSYFTPNDVTATNSVYNNSISITSASFATFASNFCRIGTGLSANYILQGPSILNNYFFGDDATANFHYLQLNASSTVDGNVFDSRGNSGQADCILLGTPGSAQTMAIIRNIILKSAGGECTGTIVSALGNVNVTFSVNHNTYYTGSQGCAVCETYAGHLGMLSAFKNNIAYDDTTARGYKLYDVPGNDTTLDYVASADADYNCGYSILAGSNGKGYNDLEFITGSPGANDIDVNPTFVASTRNLQTFDASVGGAGTYANAITELQKMGLSTFNSAYAVASLVTWVKNGYKVQNVLLKDAGSDGVTIGAMGYQAPANSNRWGLLGVGH